MNDGGARVLAALHDAGDRPCSGESLSSALGVSRAQIWKHVGVLRERGYGIEGTPGGGYRLTKVPDRLYAEEISRGLGTRWLGRRIRYFDEVDSTNRAALDLARGGAEHGTVVVAETQTAGRGRLGRSFFSPPGQNLYASVVLRPEIDVSAAPTLLLAAGVAVAEAVVEELGRRDGVELKWPNDLLLGGRKASGILMELVTEEARVAYAVLGVGVNLNVDPASFPDEFRERATSVAAFAGRPVDRLAFTRRLFRSLEGVIDTHGRGGFAALRGRYDAFFAMVGRLVRVSEVGGKSIEGRVDGLAESGALLVRRADDRVVTVLAGDVTLRGSPAE